MTVEHVELLVEEASMEAALALVLPKLLGDTSFTIHPHQGKPDLLGKLPAKLRAYATWIPATWRIVVIVDRDDDECGVLKQQLEDVARQAGHVTRTAAGPEGRYVVVNRLAVEELEAWYFGDWQAVRAAYPRVVATIPAKAEYRDPDGILGGTWEAFERVLQRAGYFTTRLRKIEAARAVAQHMVPGRNTSASFRALRDALKDLAS